MADIRLDVTSEIPEMLRSLATFRGQMPFAVSQALNKSGFDVRKALNQGTTRHFDQPTRFTQTAFVVERGNKADPTVLVGAQANRPYFGPQIRGGNRYPKDYEGFIRGLSGGRITGKLVPTDLALDARGNPRKELFGRIQRGLSTRSRTGFFIGTPKGGNRAPGVYRRLPEVLLPYFVLVNEPQYEPRFPIVDIGQTTLNRVVGPHLRSSIERALASARR